MFTGADFRRKLRPHSTFHAAAATTGEQWSTAGVAAGMLLMHEAVMGAFLWRATTLIARPKALIE
jgi:hypothetical protein